MKNFAIAHAMKKKMAAHMCHGGDCSHPSHMMAQGGPVDSVPEAPSKNAKAMQAGATSSGIPTWDEAKNNIKESLGMAEGGEAEMHPMIHKIMMGRMKGYSKGGMVANEDSGESTDEPTMAKADGNEFDDLALDDDMSFDSTGSNAGDELGNEQEDHDEADIIARVMKSRAKKDHNPRPA